MKLKPKKKPVCDGCQEPLEGIRLPTSEVRFQSGASDIFSMTICRQCADLVNMSADIIDRELK